MDELEILFRNVTKGIITEPNALKFYRQFMETFPGLDGESPPPGVEYDETLCTHWNAYCQALTNPANESMITTRRAILEEYAMFKSADRRLTFLCFALNAERRLLAKTVQQFHDFVTANPNAPDEQLVRMTEVLLMIQRRLDSTNRAYEDHNEDDDAMSHESTEEDVPCSGCGREVPVDDEGQYRPGYWCSRGCAYEELRHSVYS